MITSNSTSSYIFYITLLCMHDTVTYSIEAINSTVPISLNPTLYVNPPSSVGNTLVL